MPCIPFKAEGMTGYACIRGVKQKRCACGALSTRLCDAPGGKKGCNAPLCTRCTYEVAPGVDLCPFHRLEYVHNSALLEGTPVGELF